MKINLSPKCFTHRNIGIWGLGIVGKAAINYFSSFDATISVMDQRELNPDELIFLRKNNVTFFDQDQLDSFFEKNDYIIVSPGVYHPACQKYKDKIISELDLFRSEYKKPIIAVTGTVGKTSVVHLLSIILKNVMNIQTGGNIGTALFDLIHEQDAFDCALLELSSFQLDKSSYFSPNLAIWTNFFPNHIDRHGSQKHYFLAKSAIIRNQRGNQKALLPVSIIDNLEKLNYPHSNWYFMSTDQPPPSICKKITQKYMGIFYAKNNHIVLKTKDNEVSLVSTVSLPNITFLENWITICASLYLNNIPFNAIKRSLSQLNLPEHRMENVGQINNVTFYNDSKSTTAAATQAAIKLLSNHSILLLLGGIGKGVDRADLIKKLPDAVKLIVCFGEERNELKKHCDTFNKKCAAFEKLNEAVRFCFSNAKPSDQILFSPSGASFDQFSNYQERGTFFKKLVNSLA